MAAEIFSLLGSVGLTGAQSVESQLDQVGKKADSTSEQLGNSTDKTSKSSKNLVATLGTSFVAAGAAVSTFTQNSLNHINNFGERMQTTGQGMMSFGAIGKVALAGVGVSIAGLGVAIKAGMDRIDALNQANLVFQSFNAAGDTSFGNVTKAANEMTKGTQMSLSDFNTNVGKYVKQGVPEAAAVATTSLNAFVKGTSVGMTSAAAATARFNSVGMDLKSSTNTFKDMTKVLAGTGHATKEGLDAASLAISQMAGKGKLDMGNMLQLMNTMPDAMMMLSKSTGMSMGDLQNAISNGKVSYEDFSKAMTQRANDVDNSFKKQGGVMAQTGKTFEGSISNLQAAVGRFGATILQGIGQSKITDMMASIGSSLDDLGAKIAPIIPKIAEFIGKVVDLAVQFAPVIGSFLAFTTGVYALGFAFTKLGGIFTTFANHPILSMLMLLAMWIAENYAKSETFRSKVNELANQFSQFVGSLKPVLDGIQSFVKWLGQGSAGANTLKAAVAILAGGLGALLIFTKVSMAISTFKKTITESKLALNLWSNATKIATAVQTAFNYAFVANPIVGIIAVIAALVVALVAFFTKTKTGQKMWQSFMDWLKDAWNGISSFFSGLWNGIVNVFKAAVSAIGSFLSSGFGQAIMFIINPFAGLINFFVQNWSSIKQIFTSAISSISSFVSSAWNVMATIIKTTMNIIWSVIQVAWQLIKVIFEFVVGGIVAYIKLAWQGIQTVIQTVMNVIRTVIETVWNAISPFIMMVLNAIKGTFESVWNGIQTVISTVLNVINTVITSVWNFIAPFIMGVLNGIANTFSMVWNGIQMVISTVMNVISSIISSVWNGISGVISGVVNGISSFVSGAWNTISSVTTSVFNAVSGVISGVWNGISSFISGVVNGVSNTVSSVWSGLGGIASGAFNGVMSAASNVLNGVSSFVSGIVNKIKGFFNFHLSFPKIDIPHIPMPHFKISGDFNPLKGKIPSVGVDWYAKGGIMTGPTIFGMNGNNLQVGGEAGREAVLPLTKDVLGKIGAGAIQAAPQAAMAGNFTVNQYMTEQPNITPREQQRLARTEFTKAAREYKRGN